MSTREPETENQEQFKLSILIVVAALCAVLAGCGTNNATEAPLRTQVLATKNPLVAAVSVGSGCAGQAMAEFGPDTSYGRSTSWYPVAGQYQHTGFFVGGMRASTSYHIRVERQCSGNTTFGNDMTFTTGALPATPFPAIQVTRPDPAPAGAESSGIELIDTIATNVNMIGAFFTDRDGNPIWYYDVGQNKYPFVFKLLPNGHIAIVIVDTTSGDSILREIDLAGNTIREMDITVLQQKVAAAGYNFVPLGYHHDVLPLANGHLIVLVFANQTYTDVFGYSGPTQVQGDQLIDLDEDWNPVWEWNSFDHLDVNRYLAGLPDWTHSNAIVYLPQDGNLLLSMRHQSWILKIDYSNGTGTGNVLWKLGNQGDFFLAEGDDPSLWFSFQHFPSLVSQNGSQTTLAVWDNGDFRPLSASGGICAIPGPPFCYSRATIFQIDESGRVANLVWSDSPGYFSVWGGSVNQLPNGNVEFDLNAPLTPPAANVASEVQEVTQTSDPQILWKMDIALPMNAYRAYRVPSLYPDVSWRY